MRLRIKNGRAARSYEYDVCLSFAGEDRAYVRQVAEALRTRGVRVFFDEYAQADLWGKDLYTHLDDVYQNAARYCVLFASKHYAKKVWTNHERESAQARAIRQHAEYILPARFDSTKIPGLRPTVGEVDLRSISPEKLADLIEQKLGDRQREEYFPPIPDRLFTHMKARSTRARNHIKGRAYDFFKALTRMNPDERRAVITVFLQACAAGLPDNAHINVDLLRRYTGFPTSKLLRLLGGVQSLGFYTTLRDGPDDNSRASQSKVIEVEWHDMTADHEISGNATLDAATVLTLAADGLCEECALERLLRVDFSQLASATRETDNHR
jgi:hypothetical protein